MWALVLMSALGQKQPITRTLAHRLGRHSSTRIPGPFNVRFTPEICPMGADGVQTMERAWNSTLIREFTPTPSPPDSTTRPPAIVTTTPPANGRHASSFSGTLATNTTACSASLVRINLLNFESSGPHPNCLKSNCAFGSDCSQTLSCKSL